MMRCPLLAEVKCASLPMTAQFFSSPFFSCMKCTSAPVHHEDKVMYCLGLFFMPPVLCASVAPLPPHRPEQAVAAPMAQFSVGEGALPSPEWLYAQLKLNLLQQQQGEAEGPDSSSSSNTDAAVLQALQEVPDFYQVLAYELLGIWQREVGSQVSKENALPQVQEDVQQLLRNRKGSGDDQQQQQQHVKQQRVQERVSMAADQTPIDDSSRVCHKCNRVGHISKNCPYGSASD